MAPSADDRKPYDKRSYYTYLLIDFLLSPLPAFLPAGDFFNRYRRLWAILPTKTAVWPKSKIIR